MLVRKEELIQSPSDVRPHVVLLGAGASRAALPNGDRYGSELPLMDDLVDVIGLRSLLGQAGQQCNDGDNFEKIYSKLASTPEREVLVEIIESEIGDYFSSLQLPQEATIYDYLLLSLRRKDAVFTFNWDPFLFDSYKRNAHIASLPEIFFLHGNVRIGMCPNHAGRWGERQLRCPICLEPLDDVHLLYPVEDKEYSNHPYIKASWEAARYFLREAFVLTIFGYSAPSSDVDAVALLRHAWMERSNRKIEHIEIIDVESSSVLYGRWKTFLPTGHLKSIVSLDESWITMYPRRSVEASKQFALYGEPCEEFPLKKSKRLGGMHKQFFDIAEWERDANSGGN